MPLQFAQLFRKKQLTQESVTEEEGHFFVFWGLLLDPNMPVSWSRVDPPHNKQQAQLAGGPNWSWQLAEISERRDREAHLAPSYQLAAS